jgi:streptolysin S family bacteriocin protoxin
VVTQLVQWCPRTRTAVAPARCCCCSALPLQLSARVGEAGAGGASSRALAACHRAQTLRQCRSPQEVLLDVDALFLHSFASRRAPQLTVRLEGFEQCRGEIC